MRTETIELTTADGPMPAYEAVPDDGAPVGLVVIQEAFGVNGHIEDVTRRFAAEGFHAVAPHLYHRTGGGTVAYGHFEQARPHIGGLDDKKLMTDVDAAVARLREAGLAPQRVGVVGFCMGGRVAFLVAARRSLGAAVSFYGGGIVTTRFPQFPSLLSEVPSLKTPWLGLFGGRDQGIPLDDVERLQVELGAATVDVATHVYADAEHGFFCDQRPSYDPDAAADAWPRTLDWFRQHLGS